MQTMQSKIIDAIAAAVTASGLEPVAVTAEARASYSNVGAIHAQRGHITPVRIDYDFQSNYCTIKVIGSAITKMVELGLTADNPPQFRLELTRHKDGQYFISWWMLHYGTERVQQMLTTLADILNYAATDK